MNPLMLLPWVKKTTVAVDAVTTLGVSLKGLSKLFGGKKEDTAELITEAILWQAQGRRLVEITIEPIGENPSELVLYAFNQDTGRGSTIERVKDLEDL